MGQDIPSTYCTNGCLKRFVTEKVHPNSFTLKSFWIQWCNHCIQKRMAHPTGCSFPWEGFRSHPESKYTNYLGSHWFTVNRRRWYTLWYTVAHLCQRCNSIGFRTTPGFILRFTQSHLCLQSLWDSVAQDCSVGFLKSVTESTPLVVSTLLKKRY